MSEKCSGLQPNALFPYRANRGLSGWWEDLRQLKQYGLAGLYALIFAALVTFVVVITGAVDAVEDQHRSSIDTLAHLFGTFAIAAIGYSAWARRRMDKDLANHASPTNDHHHGDNSKVHGDCECAHEAHSIYSAKINLHMIFTVVPYSLFLVTYLLLSSRAEIAYGLLICLMVFATTWMLSNVLLLCCVGISLNDFLDDA